MSTFPPEGKNEASVPWMYPFPQVMAKSLAMSYNKTVSVTASTTPDLVFNLPEGVPKGVWKQVAIDSGITGARPATQADRDNGVPIWSVSRIAVRGLESKVDIVYPDGNIYQLAVVTLRADPLQPFHASAFQRFLIPTEEPNIHNPFDTGVVATETRIVHTEGESEGGE
jgi:hypothetical protein